MSKEELEKIRLHIGIHSGYERIERDPVHGLVASRRYDDPLKPLPPFNDAVRSATAAFQYLTSPLLHDLNRLDMLLEIWEEHIPPAPHREMKNRIGEMARWIVQNGGRP